MTKTELKMILMLIESCVTEREVFVGQTERSIDFHGINELKGKIRELFQEE